MKLAIIPARSGSKRIPKKNICNFHGRPMISYPLEAIKKTNIFDKIHISTDSIKIKEIVEGMDFNVDFLRSKELADDVTPVLDVARWVLNEYKSKGEVYDSFALVMPCSPFLMSHDLERAYGIFERYNSNLPVLSVCRYPAPIEWAFAKEGEDVIVPKNYDLLGLSGQSLKDYYYDTGTFSIQNSQHVLESKVISRRFVKYILPRWRAFDIDTIEDLEEAKIMYEKFY